MNERSVTCLGPRKRCQWGAFRLFTALARCSTLEVWAMLADLMESRACIIVPTRVIVRCSTDPCLHQPTATQKLDRQLHSQSSTPSIGKPHTALPQAMLHGTLLKRRDHVPGWRAREFVLQVWDDRTIGVRVVGRESTPMNG